jgi:hypothetical protein
MPNDRCSYWIIDEYMEIVVIIDAEDFTTDYWYETKQQMYP